MLAVTLLVCVGIFWNESSTMYHSTHGFCNQPYIPMDEKPPALPDLDSANCAKILPYVV